MIALSFDVEPDFPPHFDSNKGVAGLKKICQTLRKHKADATFFICADFLEKNPEILDYMKGFELACHGLNNVDLTKLGDLQLGGEILEAVEIFEEYGIDARGFRAPYAKINKRVFQAISRLFEYDSSLLFYQRKPKGVDMREIPIFNGGKLFGVKPSLFKKALSFPLKSKVFFIHPWEYGGFDFKKVEEKRKSMTVFGYSQENYLKNLETILEKKPVRLSDLF